MKKKKISPSDEYPPGFAPNKTRGNNTAVFGAQAVDTFCKETGCTHIIRAHQPPDLGISFRKGAKVITVFSSSHYCGQYNSAAVVLVSDHKLHLIITSNDKDDEDSEDVEFSSEMEERPKKKVTKKRKKPLTFILPPEKDTQGNSDDADTDEEDDIPVSKKKKSKKK